MRLLDTVEEKSQLLDDDNFARRLVGRERLLQVDAVITAVDAVNGLVGWYCRGHHGHDGKYVKQAVRFGHICKGER